MQLFLELDGRDSAAVVVLDPEHLHELVAGDFDPAVVHGELGSVLEDHPEGDVGISSAADGQGEADEVEGGHAVLTGRSPVVVQAVVGVDALVEDRGGVVGGGFGDLRLSRSTSVFVASDEERKQCGNSEQAGHGDLRCGVTAIYLYLDIHWSPQFPTQFITSTPNNGKQIRLMAHL